MIEPRPTLRESEHRIREWLQQRLWRDGYVGKVIARVMREYDDRGRRLGVAAPTADAEPAADPTDDAPPAEPHCHNPRRASQCGACADRPATTDTAGGGTP